MSDRSWFYAAQGQQQGPFPEIQLRNLIASGTVTPDTLVWTEGMAGWQRAGDIPGLAPGGGSRPQAVPQPVSPMASPGGRYRAGSQDSGGPLSIDFGILEFTWRSIMLLTGLLFVLPAPWALVWYLKWLVPCLQVPGRPNLSFTGSAMTFIPWYFGALVLAIAVAVIHIQWLNDLMFLVQIALYRLFFRWLVANLASNGQPLGLTFSGSFLGYLGWTVLALISVFTIIGWAWVYVASIRWFCRNLQGTRREVVFVGRGVEFLWRTLVAAIACGFIIPIPWMYRWMGRWLSSQTVLADRNSQANI